MSLSGAAAGTLGELCALLSAELRGDPGVRIVRLADLAEAGPDTLAPFTDPARLEEARGSAAGALLVRRRWPELPQPQLVCEDTRRALGLLMERFAPPPPPLPRGVDRRAVVEEGAVVDPSAWVGPLCYVGPGARVGARTQVLPFSYLGSGVEVGRDCWIGPGATLMPGSRLDDKVRVSASAVVGGEGFGFYRQEGGWRRVPSAGGVHLGAGVELGAGTCVDRGTLGVTRVGRGSKIDNLVQVGHNVHLGEDVLLCAQVGLAGSSRIEDGGLLGGQVGVADHRRVGAGARVAGQAGVVSDVPAGARVGGTPAIEQQRWLRSSVLFSRLAELCQEVRTLRRELDELRRAGSEQEEQAC